MHRLLAIVLVALTSLSLGRAPCCLVGGALAATCCESTGEQEARGRVDINCPHCQRNVPESPPRRNLPGTCKCPTLVGAEVPTTTVESVDLPVALDTVAVEFVRMPVSLCVIRPDTRAPPEVAADRSQPLLL